MPKITVYLYDDCDALTHCETHISVAVEEKEMKRPFAVDYGKFRQPDLYLVSEFSSRLAEQVSIGSSRAIILTNSNNAYFVSDGKLIRDGSSLVKVEGIDRQDIDESSSAFPIEYKGTVSKKDEIISVILSKKSAIYGNLLRGGGIPDLLFSIVQKILKLLNNYTMRNFLKRIIIYLRKTALMLLILF